MAFELLQPDDVAARLAAKGRDRLGLLAMFSSYLGGVVTDPTLMSVPLDDHMVHRGHGVFDTATLVGGRMYRLEAHLNRLLESARLGRVEHPWSRDQLAEMVLGTAAAAGVRDGSVRYWLSVGPGGFGFSPKECTEPCFYCVIFEPLQLVLGRDVERDGVAEVTVVDTPMKPELLARVKSNNYMLNVLMHLEAVDRGGTFGIQATADGMLAESCVLSVCVLTEDGVLLTPPFEGILAGTTVRTVLDLCAGRLVTEGLLTAARQEPVNIAAVRAAGLREVFVCGGDVHVFPVISWDGLVVGDGRRGPVAARLQQLLADEASGLGGAELVAVPYAVPYTVPNAVPYG